MLHSNYSIRSQKVNDGESTWLEGLVLIGLYGIIAVSFWWG